eukprot:1139324-Pelagomonas_calceolata.AAC.2
MGFKALQVPNTKFRLSGAQQAEKEDRSSNENKSKVKAERLPVEFQTFNSKQSQAQLACHLRKARQLNAEHDLSPTLG